jgi:hypothetical protein
MTQAEYGNDSKRAGGMKSIYNNGGKKRGKRSSNRVGQKTALRRYKKVARREGIESLFEETISKSDWDQDLHCLSVDALHANAFRRR